MKKLLFSVAISFVAVLSSQSQITNTVAQWTFDGAAITTSTAATFSPRAAETGSGSLTVTHASALSVYSGVTGNGSAKALNSDHWAVNDYYQFQVSTVGFSGIQLSYDQTRSSTGPTAFSFSYSTDGVNFTPFGSSYSVAANSWNSTTRSTASIFSFDLSSDSSIDNLASVYFRITDTTGPSGSAGTGRMDNFTVFTVTPVPEPSTFALLGVGTMAGMFVLVRRKK